MLCGAVQRMKDEKKKIPRGVFAFILPPSSFILFI